MSLLGDSLTLVFNPATGWQRLAASRPGTAGVLLFHTAPLALIPAISWYLGVTRAGWSVAGETMTMTTNSALPLTVLFFGVMLSAVLVLGWLVHWMAKTYESDTSVARGVTLISATATPFFLIGVIGIYPVLWIDIVIGVLVACYCVYLLYVGTSVMMGTAPERGFLFASAALAAALVGIVVVFVVTIVLWDLGFAPEYDYATPG